MIAEQCSLCEAGSIDGLSVGAIVGSQIEPAKASWGVQATQVEPGWSIQAGLGFAVAGLLVEPG